MGRPRLYTEEESVKRRRESQRKSSNKYYAENIQLIRTKKKTESLEYRRSGLIMIDTLSGDEFEYDSVKECSEDMGITEYAIRRGLNRGVIHDGYKFKRRD